MESAAQEWRLPMPNEKLATLRQEIAGIWPQPNKYLAPFLAALDCVEALHKAPCSCRREFVCPDCKGHPLADGEDQFEGAYICEDCSCAYSFTDLPVRVSCPRCTALARFNAALEAAHA